MDSLHAPWRIDYILAPRPPLADVSLFTRIAQSNDDEANYVLARGRTCFALLNTYPYTGGHLMTVPYRQVPDFNGLTERLDYVRDLGVNTLWVEASPVSVALAMSMVAVPLTSL